MHLNFFPYDTRALLPQISAERVRPNKRRRNVKPYQPHLMANKYPSLQPEPGAMSCFQATTPDLDSPPSIGFSRRPLFQTRPRTPDVEDDLDDAALERVLCAQAAPTAVFRATLRLNAHRLATMSLKALQCIFDAAVSHATRDPTWTGPSLSSATNSQPMQTGNRRPRESQRTGLTRHPRTAQPNRRAPPLRQTCTPSDPG